MTQARLPPPLSGGGAERSEAEGVWYNDRRSGKAKPRRLKQTPSVALTGDTSP